MKAAHMKQKIVIPALVGEETQGVRMLEQHIRDAKAELDNPGIQTALVGTEALSAFYDAANMLGLTEGEIKNIFYGNARRLFFLDKDE